MKKSILCFLLIVSLCFLYSPQHQLLQLIHLLHAHTMRLSNGLAISKSNYRLIRLYMARSDNIVRILTLMGKKKTYPLFSTLIMVRKPSAHA